MTLPQPRCNIPATPSQPVGESQKQIAVTLPEALVSMHAGAVVTEDWLGHEGAGFAVRPADTSRMSVLKLPRGG